MESGVWLLLEVFGFGEDGQQEKRVETKMAVISEGVISVAVADT